MTELSGIRTSGPAHLGNYLGAVRRWAAGQRPDDVFLVADLHGMTTTHNPHRLRQYARQAFALLIASGVDPARALVFVQSDLVREHAALTWVLECTCTYGEAKRMRQFREKSGGQDSVRLGLLTYPVLQAADILLYGADRVPVGEDQHEHIELARALANRFNGNYGEVFVVPEGVLPAVGAGIKDLAEPTRTMAKSSGETPGVVFVLDSPELIRRKVERAATDDLGTVRFAPKEQPGVSNLLEILGACTGVSPREIGADVADYEQLKSTVADAVVEVLRPVRERMTELLDDPAELDRLRALGAARARERATPRLEAALKVVGLG
ncbi:tryptophan--tRNA ligase [Allokutzneria sp. A3M-2-11 16]|uniref:tryptophan--tRNA ligase n=1 Tax=Allokutzneria sp. A3M-2-11 16 TaxID=2962043 RepID=UPI0020B6A979|nr:tryptophan--tRNA ligase [Allokutzneria sp. A3M-2-11 16]MCP3798645.1 tryptophan--tRNA ligase [Allokutzneria sp. A3M-2-11 16]